MAQVDCPQCGKKVDPSDGYCPYCGFTFEEEEQASPFAAAQAGSQTGADQSSDDEPARSPVIGGAYDTGITQRATGGTLSDKGLIFNIAYLIFAAISVILLFVPFAILTDRDKTRYTIMNSNIGIGVTIVALAVLGFVFSFVKRKKIVIPLSGIGLGAYGLYSFFAISNLTPKLEKIIKTMQALEDLSVMLGEKPTKVTFTITPTYYIFAVCCIIAAGLAAATFITTTDE